VARHISRAADMPLFEAAAAEAARARADVGMGRASERAERIESGWKSTALEVLRVYSLGHETFLAEDVGIHVPPGADPRSVGAVLQDARRRGWITPAGYAPANSSNRSPKVRWRSLIYGGAA
jgi:hypothetical protein